MRKISETNWTIQSLEKLLTNTEATLLHPAHTPPGKLKPKNVDTLMTLKWFQLKTSFQIRKKSELEVHISQLKLEISTTFWVSTHIFSTFRLDLDGF